MHLSISIQISITILALLIKYVGSIPVDYLRVRLVSNISTKKKLNKTSAKKNKTKKKKSWRRHKELRPLSSFLNISGKGVDESKSERVLLYAGR